MALLLADCPDLQLCERTDLTEAVSNEWASYFRRITGDASGAEIARTFGVSGSKVSYWKRGTRPPTIAEAIRVSRTYDTDPFEGLIAAGFLTPEDAAGKVVVERRQLSAFTTVELAEELLRRAHEEGC